MTKLGAFAIGVGTGIVVTALVKTPGFHKACSAVIGAGLKLKDDASSFMETVKEDAEDVIAEAKYNNAKKEPKKA